jgi:hypothetical protein
MKQHLRVRRTWAGGALIALGLVLTPVTARGNGVRCDTGCRGLGVEKVKAGDEHCGFLPRDRKEEALEAACELAGRHRESLVSRARELAAEQCGDAARQASCRCEGELRRWENTYTHLLSQRCWSECGWAYLLGCSRATDSGNVENESEPGGAGNGSDAGP